MTPLPLIYGSSKPTKNMKKAKAKPAAKKSTAKKIAPKVKRVSIKKPGSNKQTNGLATDFAVADEAISPPLADPLALTEVSIGGVSGNFTLTPEQLLAFESAELGHDNVIIIGKPGVGKTVLTRALVSDGNKDWKVGAPTGLAALNAGGRTLHSMFSLPASQGAIAPDYDVYNVNPNTENFIRYQLSYLVVDEISMVRADMFDYIDRMLRFIKRVPDEPFGGIQLIMVGDFFQLPPVVVGDEKLQLASYGYDSPFIFSSHVFKNNRAKFKIVLLNTVLRQIGDPSFISLLNSAREGLLNAKQLAALNKQVGKPNDIRIKLAGKNKQADEINYNELRVLPPPSRKFVSRKFGQWPALPVDEQLELKVGAQVMVKKNRADMPPDYNFKAMGPFQSKVVNGTLGKVVELGMAEIKNNPTEGNKFFRTAAEAVAAGHTAETSLVTPEDQPQPRIQKEVEKVTIQLDNGDRVNIYRQRWERKVKRQEFSEALGKKVWVEEVVASYEQMPLALAWAISIHKSQGQSFDKVHIDLSKIFAAGQAYVALSRCRTLAGVSLEKETSVRAFYADRAVLDFYCRENLE